MTMPKIIQFWCWISLRSLMNNRLCMGIQEGIILIVQKILTVLLINQIRQRYSMQRNLKKKYMSCNRLNPNCLLPLKINGYKVKNKLSNKKYNQIKNNIRTRTINYQSLNTTSRINMEKKAKEI